MYHPSSSTDGGSGGQRSTSVPVPLNELEQLQYFQSRLLFFNAVSRQHRAMLDSEGAMVQLKSRPTSASRPNVHSRLGLKLLAEGRPPAAIHQQAWTSSSSSSEPVSVGDLLNNAANNKPIDMLLTNNHSRFHSSNNNESTTVRPLQRILDDRLRRVQEYQNNINLFGPLFLPTNRPLTPPSEENSPTDKIQQKFSRPKTSMPIRRPRDSARQRSRPKSAFPSFGGSGGGGGLANRSVANNGIEDPIKTFALLPTNRTEEEEEEEEIIINPPNSRWKNHSISTQKPISARKSSSGVNRQEPRRTPNVVRLSSELASVKTQEENFLQAVYDIQRKLNIDDKGLVLP